MIQQLSLELCLATSSACICVESFAIEWGVPLDLFRSLKWYSGRRENAFGVPRQGSCDDLHLSRRANQRLFLAIPGPPLPKAHQPRVRNRCESVVGIKRRWLETNSFQTVGASWKPCGIMLDVAVDSRT